MKILIIGASRGIGLEFARQYATTAGDNVIATARDDAGLARVRDVGATAVRFDAITDDANMLLGTCADGLDVLIFNAGTYGPKTSEPTPVAQNDFDAVMHTNVFAAMRVLPVLAPALVARKGKLAVLSSRMGSMGERANAAGWLYRASKAAINSVLTDLSLTLEPKGVTCLAFHPGWVRTDMGGAGADIDAKESVSGMRSVIANASARDNGRFIAYDGKAIAW